VSVGPSGASTKMFLRNPSEARLRGRLKIVAAFVAGIALGLASAGCGSQPAEKGVAASAPSWSFAARMLHRRSYTASAELGGKVYVAAGMVGNSGRPLALFEQFDPAKSEWTSLTPLPESFSAGAAASLDGRIWVVGGNSETTSGRQVFAYDVQRRRWTEEPPLPAPRTNLAVVADRGKLYAIGGLNPVEATRTVFVYDLATRRWSKAAPLPKALQALAAVVFRGEVWALGGRVRSGTIQRGVWIYNPRTNRWRTGPTLPTPMETLGTSASTGRIDAVLEHNYFTYDSSSSRWLRGPSLEVPRHALGVFTINGTLYAIGGCVVPQLEDSSVVEKIALRRVGD
jgi:Kelch motif